MPLIAANGITLSYEDTGGIGRPVVLIHGWPLSGASWSEQVPALRDAGYRVITYDRRGFGESDKLETGYDYDTLVADLAGIIGALDLRDAVLVGFSMGGGEVARYLATYDEERVTAAVLAGAVPPYLLKGEDNLEGGLARSDVDDLLAGAAGDRGTFLDGFTTEFFSAGGELRVSEEQRQQAIAMAAPAREEAVLGCIEAFATTDFRADLERISVPTLVIHGDADAIVPLEVSGIRSAKTIPGSTLVVVEGGPHGFNVSHAERFNRELIDFLGA